MREELGYLVIDDDENAYVMILGSTEPLSWRYRVYIPPGSYRVCIAFQWVASGFPEPIKKARAFAGGTEFLLTAGLGQGGNGEWNVTVITPEVGSRVTDRHGQLNWLSELNTLGSNYWQNESDYFQKAQQSYSADRPIEIMRLRAGSSQARGEDSYGPSDGLMIWIEPLQ